MFFTSFYPNHWLLGNKKKSSYWHESFDLQVRNENHFFIKFCKTFEFRSFNKYFMKNVGFMCSFDHFSCENDFNLLLSSYLASADCTSKIDPRLDNKAKRSMAMKAMIFQVCITGFNWNIFLKIFDGLIFKIDHHKAILNFLLTLRVIYISEVEIV